MPARLRPALRGFNGLLLLVLLLLPLRPVQAQELFLLKLLGGFFERKAPVPTPGPSAPPTPGATPEDQFQALLLSSDPLVLNQACLEAAAFNFQTRLRLLQQRLLLLAPPPQPFEQVLLNANALLSCRAPDGALQVLNRFSPGSGQQREQWLVMRWRAANAGLHHQLAAEALQQLAQGDLARLELIPLPLKWRDDGTLATRPALDLYAEHLLVLGRKEEAAAALLAGRIGGKLAAERLQLAVSLLPGVSWQQRDQLLERALDQAAAAEAWGLALNLLADQQQLLARENPATVARPRERLLRLSKRVDDAYSEWQLRQEDPEQAARALQLQQQLRSPRDPGGHAALSSAPQP